MIRVHSICYLFTCRKCGTEQTFKAEVDTPPEGLDAELAIHESLEAEGCIDGLCPDCVINEIPI